MRRISNYGGPLLAVCLTLTGLAPVLADTTETVTTRTTTTLAPAPLTLSGSTYVVVDPITGAIKGDYVTGTRIIDGVPLSNSYVVMDKVSRRMVGTFDANGNLVDISSVPAASNFVVSIDSRRTGLEREIDRLLGAGQITSVQAAAMRADIGNLFPDTTMSRTVTYTNAMAVDAGLNTVESRLRLFPLAQKTYTSKVIMPKFVTINGQVVLPDALTYRKMQLERRMEDEFAFGHLTKDQFTQLKADMVEISNKDANYRVAGNINDANAALEAADLNALQAKMEQYVASVNATLQIGNK
jgi:hypothetical protein